MKLKHLLHCSAPLRMLTRTAFVFGSLNSFKLIIISPRLWVSESLLIVPSLSLALQLPDGGSGLEGEAGAPCTGEASALPAPPADICGAASPHCLPSGSSPKEKNRQPGTPRAGGARLCVLCGRISENVLNSAYLLADTYWVLLFT